MATTQDSEEKYSIIAENRSGQCWPRMTDPSRSLGITVGVLKVSLWTGLWAQKKLGSSKTSGFPWATWKTVNLAYRRECLISAEQHGSCITTDVESVDMLILNSVRIISKDHMSGVIFNTFIWVPKWNLPVSINLAIKGKGDDDLLGFQTLNWVE